MVAMEVLAAVADMVVAVQAELHLAFTVSGQQ